MALLKGTLDALVLKTLSWTPRHAFEIASWIEDRSGGHFNVEDAALMQALHRLEGRNLLAAEWGTTSKGRRARYYRLTSAGRAHLQRETERLSAYAEALATVLSSRTPQG